MGFLAPRGTATSVYESANVILGSKNEVLMTETIVLI